MTEYSKDSKSPRNSHHSRSHDRDGRAPLSPRDKRRRHDADSDEIVISRHDKAEATPPRSKNPRYKSSDDLVVERKEKSERKPYSKDAPRSDDRADRPERRPYAKNAPRSDDRYDRSERRPYSKDAPRSDDRYDRSERKPYSKDAPRSDDRYDRSERKPYSKDAPRSGDRADRPERKPYSKDAPRSGDRYDRSERRPYSKDAPKSGDRYDKRERPVRQDDRGRGADEHRPYHQDRAESPRKYSSKPRYESDERRPDRQDQSDAPRPYAKKQRYESDERRPDRHGQSDAPRAYPKKPRYETDDTATQPRPAKFNSDQPAYSNKSADERREKLEPAAKSRKKYHYEDADDDYDDDDDDDSDDIIDSPRESKPKYTKKPAADQPEAVQVVAEDGDGLPVEKAPIDPEVMKANRLEESKIYGLNACFMFFKARPQSLVRAYFSEKIAKKFSEVMKFCAEQRLAYHIVPEEELERITESSHHGGVCFLVKKVPPFAHQSWLNYIKSEKLSCVVALENVGNPHNLGALMRISAHFVVKAICVNDASIMQSGAAIRTAEGGAEFVDLVSFESIEQLMKDFRAAGYSTITTSSHGGTALFSLKFPEKILIVFGDESKGLSKKALNSGDINLKIPGTDKVESLNVSSAASVILAEYWRQYC